MCRRQRARLRPAYAGRGPGGVRGYHEALRPYSVAGGYINFMDADDQVRIQDNYRGNYERLTAIKSKYDPENVFRFDQSVQPSRPR